MKPILYLDIDDTILVHSGKYSRGAPGVAEFLPWAVEHFEVWWLSMWCPGGVFIDQREQELAGVLGVPTDLIRVIPAKNFLTPEDDATFGLCGFLYRDQILKTRGIDWAAHEAGREWVWVEDGLLAGEREVLRAKKCGLRHLPCHVTANPRRLEAVAGILAKRFGLPSVESAWKYSSIWR